jgi:hypothetical protein
MKSTPREIEKFTTQLAESPRLIAELTSGLTDEQLGAQPEAKIWSAVEILAHLRACADLWSFSIYAMLAEHEPQLPDINERKWVRVAGYAGLPFAASFQVYAGQRAELLQVLYTLPTEAWERSALIFGRKHTVFTQVRRMAKHEAEHCAQLVELLRREK